MEEEEVPPVVTGTPVGASATAVGEPVPARRTAKTIGKNLYQYGNSCYARVTVNGKDVTGKFRATRAEAEADREALKAEQRQGKVERRQAQAGREQAVLDANAEALAANWDMHGGSCDMDRLSRDFVALALRGTDVVGVPGVEYSKDMHLFRAKDDHGFDPTLDVEPDDAVPTLVVELKSSSCLQPTNGKMDNPRVRFEKCDYSAERATIVVMLYIPKDVTEATPATLHKVTFWWKIAIGWKPKNSELWCTLHGGTDPSTRGIKGRLLGEVLCKEVHRRVGVEGGLLPYATRKRVFKSNDHKKGQAVIDAIAMQVLLPRGIHLLPPAGGGEGGAEDCRFAFPNGTTLNAQAKHARLMTVNSGFNVNLHRCNGSIVNADGTKTKLIKPYTQGENAIYPLGVLDVDEVGLAEYWAPTEADLLGADVSERLITDTDGNRGVTSITVHPRVEDKARLGDVVPIGGTSADDYVERTRGWLRALGPIVPLAEAQALKTQADAARRQQRLAAKAARAAQAPVTTPTPAGSKRAAAPQLIDTDAPKRVQQRKDGDLRGFFSR